MEQKNKMKSREDRGQLVGLFLLYKTPWILSLLFHKPEYTVLCQSQKKPQAKHSTFFKSVE